jgi:hypothetical protein
MAKSANILQVGGRLLVTGELHIYELGTTNSLAGHEVSPGALLTLLEQSESAPRWWRVQIANNSSAVAEGWVPDWRLAPGEACRCVDASDLVSFDEALAESLKSEASDAEPKEEMPEGTPEEREDWFEKRTKAHIARVQRYAKLLEEAVPGVVEASKDHDDSKLKEPQRTPYIALTWKHKWDDYKSYKKPGTIDDAAINKATVQHVKGEEHHPEHWTDQKAEDLINKEDRDKSSKEMVDATKMPDIAVAEMVADWAAMSEELKQGSPRGWADKNVNVRWKFTPEQKALIYKLIGVVEKAESLKSAAAVEFPVGMPVVVNTTSWSEHMWASAREDVAAAQGRGVVEDIDDEGKFPYRVRLITNNTVFCDASDLSLDPAAGLKTFDEALAESLKSEAAERLLPGDKFITTETSFHGWAARMTGDIDDMARELPAGAVVTLIQRDDGNWGGRWYVKAEGIKGYYWVLRDFLYDDWLPAEGLVRFEDAIQKEAAYRGKFEVGMKLLVTAPEMVAVVGDKPLTYQHFPTGTVIELLERMPLGHPYVVEYWAFRTGDEVGSTSLAALRKTCKPMGDLVSLEEAMEREASYAPAGIRPGDVVQYRGRATLRVYFPKVSPVGSAWSLGESFLTPLQHTNIDGDDLLTVQGVCAQFPDMYVVKRADNKYFVMYPKDLEVIKPVDTIPFEEALEKEASIPYVKVGDQFRLPQGCRATGYRTVQAARQDRVGVPIDIGPGEIVTAVEFVEDRLGEMYIFERNDVPEGGLRYTRMTPYDLARMAEMHHLFGTITFDEALAEGLKSEAVKKLRSGMRLLYGGLANPTMDWVTGWDEQRGDVTHDGEGAERVRLPAGSVVTLVKRIYSKWAGERRWVAETAEGRMVLLDGYALEVSEPAEGLFSLEEAMEKGATVKGMLRPGMLLDVVMPLVHTNDQLNTPPGAQVKLLGPNDRGRIWDIETRVRRGAWQWGMAYTSDLQECCSPAMELVSLETAMSRNAKALREALAADSGDFSGTAPWEAYDASKAVQPRDLGLGWDDAAWESIAGRQLRRSSALAGVPHSYLDLTEMYAEDFPELPRYWRTDLRLGRELYRLRTTSKEEAERTYEEWESVLLRREGLIPFEEALEKEAAAELKVGDKVIVLPGLYRSTGCFKTAEEALAVPVRADASHHISIDPVGTVLEVSAEGVEVLIDWDRCYADTSECTPRSGPAWSKNLIPKENLVLDELIPFEQAVEESLKSEAAWPKTTPPGPRLKDFVVGQPVTVVNHKGLTDEGAPAIKEGIVTDFSEANNWVIIQTYDGKELAFYPWRLRGDETLKPFDEALAESLKSEAAATYYDGYFKVGDVVKLLLPIETFWGTDLEKLVVDGATPMSKLPEPLPEVLLRVGTQLTCVKPQHPSYWQLEDGRYVYMPSGQSERDLEVVYLSGTISFEEALQQEKE